MLVSISLQLVVEGENEKLRWIIFGMHKITENALSEPNEKAAPLKVKKSKEVSIILLQSEVLEWRCCFLNFQTNRFFTFWTHKSNFVEWMLLSMSLQSVQRSIHFLDCSVDALWLNCSWNEMRRYAGRKNGVVHLFQSTFFVILWHLDLSKIFRNPQNLWDLNIISCTLESVSKQNLLNKIEF